jgi:hypothetical protein
MSLPETVRVKLSSEEAGAISLTQVVARDMPLRELVEYMLGLAGKDEARVRDLLLRGSLVSGASRFRWAGWEADAAEIRELLATFPDPRPELRFDAGRCVRAVLRGGRIAIEVPREAAVRKGLFRRSSFWDAVMEIAAASDVWYAGYSYGSRADRFQADLPASAAQRLREASAVLVFSKLRDQIRAAPLAQAELYVERQEG